MSKNQQGNPQRNTTRIQFVDHLQHPNPAPKGAKERLEMYEKIAEDDRTEQSLVEHLDELPSDGQVNLVCDILARDDEQSRGLWGI